MESLKYSKKETEIGMKDSENLLRTLVAMIHNRVVNEQQEFDIEKYIEVDVVNVLALLEKTEVMVNDEDRINRVRLVLDFLSNIEVTNRAGEKFKPLKNVKLKPQKLYFLMDSKTMTLIK